MVSHKITLDLSKSYPIWMGRSDGELYITTTTHGREFNGPTDAQLDKSSNPTDYYELVPHGDEAAIQWKVQLGTMLRKRQGVVDTPDNKGWVLAAFPENFRLYRQVQPEKWKDGQKGRAGESLPSSKNPTNTKAENTNKHEDCYLYGYPIGRQKRFRSAAEFFPHFFWLAEGTSDDRTDCECRYCAPPWIEEMFKTLQPLPGREKVGDPPPPPKNKEKASAKQLSGPANQQNVASNPLVVVKQRSASQDGKKPPKPATIKAPVAPPTNKVPMPNTNTTAKLTNPPVVVMPTSLAAPKSSEQEQDAQVGKFMYRPGELTWFNRGSAWGLSVILKRDLIKDQRNQDRPRYLVQPLSHPFSHPATKILSSEEDLRPWLAWSAPNPTHHVLAQQSLNYNTVDWKAVLEGHYGSGDVEVDGSIYAAKMIDDSFTLIEPLSNNTTTTGERSYNGLYIGGEKLWVGEPIRLRPHSQDIMIVHQIIEKLKANSTNAASATIHLVGDVYRYTTIPYMPGQEPAENPHLPIRLRQDLNYRNRITIASKRIISFWKIVHAQSRITITDIKGRWYESSTLLPILDGLAKFQDAIQRGEIIDVCTYINGRGDATGAPGRAGTRYKERTEAFGRAVPADTKISKGTDGPILVNYSTNSVQAVTAPVMAEQEQVQQPVQQPAQGVNDGDIADFMDLDYVEQGGQF